MKPTKRLEKLTDLIKRHIDLASAGDAVSINGRVYYSAAFVRETLSDNGVAIPAFRPNWSLNLSAELLGVIKGTCAKVIKDLGNARKAITAVVDKEF